MNSQNISYVFRGGNVMGNIDYEFGGDFVLEPCSLFTGCHAWKVCMVHACSRQGTMQVAM